MDEQDGRCHLLIVDEERLMRWYVSEVTTNAGFAVVEAADLGAALTFARDPRVAIDVVLLNCPRTHADLTLASTFKALRPDVRVVLMTDRSSASFAEHARSLGIDRVLVKPFSEDDIRMAVGGPDTVRLQTYAAFRPEIPRAIRQERDRLAAAIARAGEAHDALGVAARSAEELIRAHACNENRFALAPLGLLPLLANGFAWPEMRPAIAMAATLHAELPAMLEEHAEIISALHTVEAAAERAGRADLVVVVRQFVHLIDMEVEVLYPTTILIGKFLDAQLNRDADRN